MLSITQEAGDFIQLQINLGTLIFIPLFLVLFYLVVKNHQRLKRIEKLLVPKHTDERGIRYYPTEEELPDDIADKIRKMRAERERELREMEKQ